MGKYRLIIGMVLLCLVVTVTGCGKDKKSGVAVPATTSTEKNSSPGAGTMTSVTNPNGANQPEDPSKEGQAEEIGWLEDNELSLAGVFLTDTPDRVKEVWGAPNQEFPDQDYPDSVVWRYKLDGGVQLDFLVNPVEGWLISITSELPENWEGGSLPEKAQIATFRNLRMGDTVEQLEKVYGPWADAGDGFLYTTKDLAAGLKIGVRSGKITRIFLFVGD